MKWVTLTLQLPLEWKQLIYKRIFLLDFTQFWTILTTYPPSITSSGQTYSQSVHMTKRVLLEGQDNTDILYQQIVNGAGIRIGHMAQLNIIAPLPQIYIWVKYYCLFAKTKTNKYVFQASPPCIPICNDVNT